MTTEFIPKGGMCRVCVNRDNDCSALPFHDYRSMAPAEVGALPDDAFQVVLCEEFMRERRE